MSIPVIPYTEDQADVLSDQHFDAILQNLGFHLAEDVGQIFHRIPEFWTPNDCFEKVKQLGPVQKGELAIEYMLSLSCWWLIWPLQNYAKKTLKILKSRHIDTHLIVLNESYPLHKCTFHSWLVNIFKLVILDTKFLKKENTD